jgi:succinate dehydrogenase hydrophobic anchor subunit
MGERSASLLTKTQRQRLRTEFESVDADAKQRDQRLIRQRVRAGLLDYRLLATYPDSQYDLAFDDVSEEEFRTALADTYLAVERLRALHQYDRDQLILEARNRAETVAAEADDVGSLDRLALRTETEVRQQTEERLGVSRWVRRARTGIVLSGCGIFVAGVAFVLTQSFVGAISEPTSIMLFLVAAVAVLLAGLCAMIIVGHELLAVLTAGETLAIKARERWQTIQHRLETVQTWLVSGDDRSV